MRNSEIHRVQQQQQQYQAKKKYQKTWKMEIDTKLTHNINSFEGKI